MIPADLDELYAYLLLFLIYHWNKIKYKTYSCKFTREMEMVREMEKGEDGDSWGNGYREIKEVAVEYYRYSCANKLAQHYTVRQ